MAGNTSTPGSSSLLRGVAVLECFDANAPELSVTEIARRTGLPTSTAGRITAQLAEAGMLERRPNRRLRMGTTVWEMGLLADVGLRLRERALPFMVELYESTGENIHLAVRAGREALYVDRLAGSRAVPTISRMGGRLPLHTTGVGKVLLAAEDDEFIEKYISSSLARPTAHSITSPARLRTDIDQVRERGYALTSSEQTLGNVSVALPIIGGDGRAMAALGVVMHTARADVPRQVGSLRRAVDGIAASLRD